MRHFWLRTKCMRYRLLWSMFTEFVSLSVCKPVCLSCSFTQHRCTQMAERIQVPYEDLRNIVRVSIFHMHSMQLSPNYFCYLFTVFVRCNTGHSPVGRRPTGVAHSKITRVRVLSWLLTSRPMYFWLVTKSCHTKVSNQFKAIRMF